MCFLLGLFCVCLFICFFPPERTFFFFFLVIRALFSHQHVKLPRLSVSKADVPTLASNHLQSPNLAWNAHMQTVFTGIPITSAFFDSAPRWFHSKNKKI